jgi:hypothetical protein
MFTSLSKDHRMRAYPAPLVVLLSVLLLACSSSFETRFHYNKRQDFGALKTFAFLPAPKKEGQNEVALGHIRAAVTRGLQKKGLTLSEDRPDMVIAIYAGVSEAENLTDWGYSYTPYGPQWRASGYEQGGDIDRYEFESGTLLLDFVTPDEKTAVWRGIAQAALPAKRTPGEVEAIINDAVSTLLENYPPATEE